MMYADDYDGKFPTTTAGSHPVNVIKGGYYTRWMWFGTAQGYKVPQTWTQPNGAFQGLGMLYPQKLSGNSKICFCPGLNSKNSMIGSKIYEPLLTTTTAQNDSNNPGSVRTSYITIPGLRTRTGRVTLIRRACTRRRARSAAASSSAWTSLTATPGCRAVTWISTASILPTVAARLECGLHGCQRRVQEGWCPNQGCLCPGWIQPRTI